MKKIFVMLFLMGYVLISYSQVQGTYKDVRNGKVYKTVKIGKQIWMAENFSFRPDSGSYWAYDNIQSNAVKYGYLYDLETAKRVVPKGWHLPTYSEADTLVTYLTRVYKQNVFDAVINGGKSGFNALFGGIFDYGVFKNDGYVGFWTSDESIIFTDAVFLYTIGLKTDDKSIFITNTNSKNGIYIRLIKD